MTGFALDGLILFICSVYIVTQYRILPIVGTPYWLFGLLFILLTVYLFIAERFKTIMFWAILSIVLVGTTVTAIVDRHNTAPIYGVHDIILQQEAAMRFLLEGKNPYKETYVNTPMADWHYGELGRDAINPALFHFVMPPWYLLFPFFFYVFMIPMFGYFDGRIALLFCLLGLIVILLKWFKHKNLGRLAAGLIALGPGLVQYFIEGRSDVFALFWFAWSLYLLEKKKLFWSSVIFGFALLSKQTIWFAAPFYIFYLYRLTIITRPRIFFQCIGFISLVILTIAGPFLWWDAKAFIDSIVLYLSTGYPVSGYGLGMLLYEFHIIKDIHDYYPFIFWQVGIGIPAIVLSLRYLSKKVLISRLLVGYAVTLMIVWYVSRYFNNSHLSYIGSVFILGMLKAEDEK